MLKRITDYFFKHRMLLAALLLFVFFLQGLDIAVSKSNTFDEPLHITSGYAYLTERNAHVSPPHHPVLGRMINSIFTATLLDLDFDRTILPETAADTDFFAKSIKFLFENNVEGSRILFLSRLPIILLGVLLGLYVYLWSSRLWGGRGGLLALFFYCLSPNILAHSTLATNDLPAAAFIFIAAYYLWVFTEEGVSVKRAALCGVALGLAFTAKHTGLFILPLVGLSIIITLNRETPKRTATGYAVMAAVVYLTIWAVYGFSFESPHPPHQDLLWGEIEIAPAAEAVIDLARNWRLLPETYLYSLGGMLTEAGDIRLGFLMGEYSYTGWWYYFIFAFLIKTPIATIFFLGASAAYLFTRSGERMKGVFLMLTVVVVFTAVSMQNVNIGLRHVLPVYPFIFTMIGYLACVRTESVRTARVFFVSFCLWFLVSSLSTHPHRLAYFNEFVGGPKNGHHYLVDSNLDWGQDLVGLKRYMDDNDIDEIKLAYFGLSDPRYYGINYEYLPSYIIFEPPPVRREVVPMRGYFAISATMLQGVYLPDKAYYKRVFGGLEPIDRIGYSILIYKF